MTTTIEERVARGAALLDREAPGWAVRIPIAKLEMSECGRCVLGLLFRSYYNGVEVLALTVDDPAEWRQTRAAEHGFYHTEIERLYGMSHSDAIAIADAEYSALRAAWLAEIRARLAHAPDPWQADPAAVALDIRAVEMF